MAKDFDAWNIQKQKLHATDRDLFFHEREIWWCTLGVNVGHEQDGKGWNFLRPIIVIKKFNNDLLFGVPLTTAQKTSEYYFFVGDAAGRTSSAILSQVRPIDAKRLKRKIGMLDIELFCKLKEEIVTQVL